MGVHRSLFASAEPWSTSFTLGATKISRMYELAATYKRLIMNGGENKPNFNAILGDINLLRCEALALVPSEWLDDIIFDNLDWPELVTALNSDEAKADISEELVDFYSTQLALRQLNQMGLLNASACFDAIFGEESLSTDLLGNFVGK